MKIDLQRSCKSVQIVRGEELVFENTGGSAVNTWRTCLNNAISATNYFFHFAESIGKEDQSKDRFQNAVQLFLGLG